LTENAIFQKYAVITSRRMDRQNEHETRPATNRPLTLYLTEHCGQVVNEQQRKQKVATDKLCDQTIQQLVKVFSQPDKMHRTK